MKINYIGDTPLKIRQVLVKGEFVILDGEQFYMISNFDRMAPFFMSIVSDSDHWLFLSSKGGLTAGRKNPENALFPYLTDDKIHDASENTGSKSLIYIETKENFQLWEPFSDAYKGIYNLQRNLYKNSIGNKIIFEEINYDLQISFRYSYCNSEKFGLVKKSTLINQAGFKRRVDVLDGLQNILPSGVNRSMQTSFSTLVDAYKKNELLQEEGIALYTLSSIPVDKAEPSESLQCTIAWSAGLENAKYLLSSDQVEKFRVERTVDQENEKHGIRGSYFVCSHIELTNNAIKEWYTLLDINKDANAIIEIKELLKLKDSVIYTVTKDINKGSGKLVEIVANADGIELSEDKLTSARHFSNALFNCMRGGIFNDNYFIERRDFSTFITKTNGDVANKYQQFIRELPERLPYQEFTSRVRANNDPQLIRICSEYLPLTFGRRHGDPSRPWNVFSIDIKREDGSKILSYQGNWRDIFQNWEALSFSFPEYIEGMISKFVNATTADGYNPYRLMREGFDWEVLDPHDPWSNIGYWGDHQIVYLLKLLELSMEFHPGELEKLMNSEIFSYAHLPYRIKPYVDLLKNPSDSIVFDQVLHNELMSRASRLGSDGKLLFSKAGEPYLVNLAEKILVLVLAKFSNFVPGGGIWMNTQRPEWNDANNALVGRGLSMVSLNYLRRFLYFFQELARKLKVNEVRVSEEVVSLFKTIKAVLTNIAEKKEDVSDDVNRKNLLNSLGEAGSEYREIIYEKNFSEKKIAVSTSEITNFCKAAILAIDKTIKENQRKDSLSHSYNLMKLRGEKEISVVNLYEMLEGQVAVLSSGYLNSVDSLALLDSLKISELYRADQNSYMLYPRRRLQTFIEKNIIPESDFSRSELLKQLVKDGNKQLVSRDRSGKLHFHYSIKNTGVLQGILTAFSSGIYKELAENESQRIQEIYENVFHHSSFTGRSGTFYKYEGLGSIYWHMVSKLQLVVKDLFFEALENGEKPEIIERLRKSYYEIKDGIGVHKSPELYGAFPTDPYSHTPAHAGVQQPGMTGQVKEDILSRFAELGLRVNDGVIHFNPSLLNSEEFLTEPAKFNYFDLDGNPRIIELGYGMLAFTYCQVPVIYHRSEKIKIRLTKTDASLVDFEGLTLSQADSLKIFSRDGYYSRIDVFVLK